MRKGVLGSTSPIYWSPTLFQAWCSAKYMPGLTSLHLGGRCFHYSHPQMGELELRLSDLSKIRYPVPIRAPIGDQDGLTLKPTLFTMMLLNYHSQGGTKSLGGPALG